MNLGGARGGWGWDQSRMECIEIIVSICASFGLIQNPQIHNPKSESIQAAQTNGFLVTQLALWPPICTAAKAKVKRSEQKLAEVKQLYQQKYGQEVDDATDLREEEAEKARAIAEALELENWGINHY